MQIHEITHKQKLNEGVADAIGYVGGKTVSGVKNVGSAIASPFKDIGQAYTQGRMDQRTAKLADKMYRGWQNYSVQWAKSQGGQYAKPGSGGAQATPTQAGGTVATNQPAKAARVKAQDLFATIQNLDDRTLKGIIKVLDQRVGPGATMNALKQPETVAQVEEAIDWAGMGAKVAQGAKNVAGAVQRGYQVAKPYAQRAGQAIKSAPGAVADVVGGTAGTLAAMPDRAKTAYRGSKFQTAGPKMTGPELQMALQNLSDTEAKKLLTFIQQIQQMRKAGIREGVTPDTLIPSYEQALKAFVQKNMLAGFQYSRLQNVQQIDDLIKKIVDPANDTDAAQRDLWNKLTLAAGVAQHNAAQAGGTQSTADGEKSTGAARTGGGTETADELKSTIAQTLDKSLQAVKSAGALVRQKHTDNNDSIRSTGVPAVDALLLNMGFRPA
jgi:hypothetical protein